MTTKQADKLILSGQAAIVRWPHYGPETASIRIIRRDRWDLYCTDGAIYDRGETELVEVC